MTITAEELARLRAETPGCANVAHLNNAGASLMPEPVYEAVRSHLEAELRTGGYEAAAAAAPRLEDTYRALAELVGGRPEEIALAENQTRAWDMAFYGIDLEPGDRILTSRAEYSSQHLAFLQRARRTGASVEVLEDDEHGQLSLEALAETMDERVRVVNVVHMPTFGGLVNPAEEVGAIVREHPRALYLLDACQSAGQRPLDVRAIGCDVLAGTGRKFLRGPRGTGFLWVRREVMDEIEPPFVDLGGADWLSEHEYRLHGGARRYETWEGYVAGRIGLGVAARYALTVGLDRIAERVGRLAGCLRERLEQIDGVQVRDTGRVRGGIVTFTVAGSPAAAVMEAARAAGVNVYVITAQDARLSFDPRAIDAVVRASVHYFNTEEELERLLDVVG